MFWFVPGSAVDQQDSLVFIYIYLKGEIQKVTLMAVALGEAVG